MSKSKVIILITCGIIGFVSIFVLWGNDLLIRFENHLPSSFAQISGITIVQNAKRLPTCGANYQTYSPFLSALGRTHVHSRLKTVLLESFQQLERICPQQIWVYGETGWKNGSNFWPHRTHRNGLCVDFMVPVIDRQLRSSAVLPVTLANAYGYKVRFDENGIYNNVEINFGAIVKHLWALDQVCKSHGLRIKRVIFDPPLLKRLKSDKQFHTIAHMPFMLKQAWFPHDSHYHIDFEIME